ncbi:hypothetical protein [Streptomyces sp. NPDC059909]|uniref:hypothetical protein n=1 Tax=Streptomyces sp. NPDC059909 TaxID=3346998 RepID=UPI0036595CB4
MGLLPARIDTDRIRGLDALGSPWLSSVGGIDTAGSTADVGHEVPTARMAGLVTGTLGAPAAALG